MLSFQQKERGYKILCQDDLLSLDYDKQYAIILLIVQNFQDNSVPSSIKIPSKVALPSPVICVQQCPYCYWGAVALCGFSVSLVTWRLVIGIWHPGGKFHINLHLPPRGQSKLCSGMHQVWARYRQWWSSYETNACRCGIFGCYKWLRLFKNGTCGSPQVLLEQYWSDGLTGLQRLSRHPPHWRGSEPLWDS